MLPAILMLAEAHLTLLMETAEPIARYYLQHSDKCVTRGRYGGPILHVQEAQYCSKGAQKGTTMKHADVMAMRGTRRSVLFPVVLIALTCVACTTESPTDVATPQAPANLLQNPSFERSGKGCLDHWVISSPSKVQSVQSAPSGGGKWSLRLTADSTGDSFAETSMPAPTGVQKVLFSVWGRCSGKAYGWATVSLIRGSKSFLLLEADIGDTVWTQAYGFELFPFGSFFTAGSSDQLVVRLQAHSGAKRSGEVYFDRLSLLH
jgi:hypothetical protein